MAGGGVSAQDQIPSQTMTKLGYVFGGVRDGLWLVNDEFWHDGALNRCIAAMRLVTRINPHETEAYENVSWLMYSDLREEDSEAILREGLANNPDVYDLYLELGTFCYFRMRYQEAINLYAGCVTFADAPRYVRSQLAHAFEKNGQLADALEIWLQMEAIDPESDVPRLQIDRIMQGGEPSQVPEMISGSIETRKQDRLNRDNQ
jgi:tetratricopeptide (TPR) repeat protein